MVVPYTRRGFGRVAGVVSALVVQLAILSPQASAAVTTCDGDANGDGTVNFGDITNVLGNWLNDYTPGTGPGDANGDGVVNFADITSVLGNWLTICVSTLRIDEPGTWHSPPAAPLNEHDIHGLDYCATSVYASTGEFHCEAIDLAIPGRGLHYTMTRKYRSRAFERLNAPGAILSVMGNNWTHSYDICVEDDGAGNLLLSDGNSRKDLYEFDPSNLVWVRVEFFREIRQEIDLSYTVLFAHTGVWRLNALDGSPTAGKINAIEDRNGNVITFQYNPFGQLQVVIDALTTPANPRVITYAYNGDGLLASITDWTGRTVTYAYYNDGDAGGSFGDLKSVTSPAIVATPDFPVPPGHEYVAGKTTTFTYSKGFADERLNHNLLTITDPKGQTFLTNTYALPVDPSLLDFDRVSRQVYGNPTDTADFFYKRIIGDIDVTAVLRTIINDRNGNVEEWIYDIRNRPVRVEEFTGRANPLLVTTDTTNRPINPLRPTDPPSFVKKITWNPESLPNDFTAPNLTVWRLVWASDTVIFGRRSGGNLVEIHRLPGPLGGNQSQIDELLIYDPFTNFVTQHTDGRGNVTTIVRDPNGNATRKIDRIATIVDDYAYNSFGQMTLHVWPDNGSGHRRRDVFTYYDPLSPQHGYLFERIADAAVLALTTRSTYDRVGNEIRLEDAKGQEEISIYNQLNQRVLHQSRAVLLGTPPLPVRYETEIFYDANDMPARVDILNIDENGLVVAANPHFTTINEYDILNYRVTSFQEKVPVFVPRVPPALDGLGLNPADFIKVEYEYDANRNRTLVRSGEATNGNQPNNVVRTEYDERDLLFRSVRGAGGVDQSTTQFDYDGNGNTIVVTQGLEATALGGTPRVTTKGYDGYDRLVRIIDPMGNEPRFIYDANSNVVQQLLFGAAGVDVPGNAGDVRLRERNTTYDPFNRPIIVVDTFFNPVTQLPLDDGFSIRSMTWTDVSQVSLVVDDRGNSDSVTYDTVLRPNVSIDALGNNMLYSYDNNSNVLRVTSSEINGVTGPGVPAEIFVEATNTYDAIDRLVTTQDGTGNTSRVEYDSRSNAVRMLDPNNIETLFIYDPLSRPIQVVRDMNGGGADPLDPTDILLKQFFDDTNRAIRQLDDNDNELQRDFDDLNRSIRDVLLDVSEQLSTYDVHDNRITHTDANGSTAANTYDLNNRLTRRDIVVGPGVSAETTFEEFDWDGLSRLLRAEDDDSLVLRTWDSLNNMITERIDTRVFQYTYDGVGNQLSVLYPSTTFLTRTYDPLDRVSQIFDGGFLAATYLYAGPSRVARRTLFNNTRTDYVYDGISGVANPPGDLGFKQLITTNHLNTVTAADIDVREYAWGGAQNKTSRTDVRAGGPQRAEAFTYDDAYRLSAVDVTDPLLTPIRNTLYALDGVGNRQQVTENAIPLPYFMDSTFPFPADSQVNQYSQAPDDLLREHDENGNLTSRTMADLSVRSLTFNYYDYLVVYADPNSGTSATYRYDALGRRIAKVVTTPLGVEETQFTYALDEQCDGRDDDCDGVVEEWDGVGALKAGYIRSHGRQLFINRGGLIRTYHYDDMGNTTVLTDNFGNVTERYEYDDFGRPSVFDSVGNPLPSTALENPFLFHSHFHDPETGYYLARNRYLDPEAGRFITRDPSGIWADEANLGNAYSYAGNNPWTNVDPNGRVMVHSAKVNAGNVRKHGGGGGAGKVSVQDMNFFKFASALEFSASDSSFGLGRMPRSVHAFTGRRPLTGSARSFCVQYRETDFNFVARLMEHEGIYHGSVQSDPAPLFRPGRLTSKPTVSGPQTVVVVGQSGEEIYTDKYGRVKVQFHWDREGKNDENSSCWIRVSQSWAGNDRGTFIMPEIKDEDIVPFTGPDLLRIPGRVRNLGGSIPFMQGDPDRPIVIGRVYAPLILIDPRVKYTMFTPDGAPLRARPSTTWKEYGSSGKDRVQKSSKGKRP